MSDIINAGPTERLTALADRMEIWPADKLQPYERNPRTHSDEQVDQIAASVIEFGWTNPVLIDEQGGLLAGHGRLVCHCQPVAAAICSTVAPSGRLSMSTRSACFVPARGTTFVATLPTSAAVSLSDSGAAVASSSPPIAATPSLVMTMRSGSV